MDPYGYSKGSSSYNNASGWNGWQYQTPNTNSSPSQSQTGANSSPGENKNVSYVKLNWGDILGGKQNVTTTGTSGIQLPNITFGSPQSPATGWTGTGYHQGGTQDPSRPSPKFSISVGTNQGDQVVTNNAGLLNYKPQQNDNGGGDRDKMQTTVGDATIRPKPRRVKIIDQSAYDPSKFSPCGKCSACEHQNKAKPLSNNMIYTMRPLDEWSFTPASNSKLKDQPKPGKCTKAPSKIIPKKK